MTFSVAATGQYCLQVNEKKSRHAGEPDNSEQPPDQKAGAQAQDRW